jgi:hypothetical protein
MKLYLVMRGGLYTPVVLGIFTSLEMANKAVQEWCENDNKEWEHLPKDIPTDWASSYVPVCFPDTRPKYYDTRHSIFIEEVDANKFENEGLGTYYGN